MKHRRLEPITIRRWESCLRFYKSISYKFCSILLIGESLNVGCEVIVSVIVSAIYSYERVRHARTLGSGFSRVLNIGFISNIYDRFV
jgi:hypothetical protein